jgi:nucleoid DNA-binding protein
MTKKEIVREVSAKYGIDQGLAKQIVQFVLDSIVRSLEKEGRIELRNFGVFEVKRRAARVARNPRTNEPLRVPPKTVVSFQPGKRLARLAEEFTPATTAPDGSPISAEG